MSELHIGLIVNPLAGLGGRLALKGSDGEALRELAHGMDAQQRGRSMQRALRALQLLAGGEVPLRISAWAGDMGESTVAQLPLQAEVLGSREEQLSGPADTREAALALRDAGVDVLVFAGGDGTARDIYDALGDSLPVLGIPAGVKMHSAVFAVSPEAAGELLLKLATGGLVGVQLREVRDIDEEAFRHDVVRSRFYGEMPVPGDGSYLQHTKVGGRESHELVAAEIAAWLVEQMTPDCLYCIGPGSTTAAVMEELQLPNTLLGVDLVCAGELLASDVDETGLLRALDKHGGPAQIVVTAIGGQGHIFGRGNQHISAAVIRRVGLDNIVVVAAKSKIAALDGRPLLVDTNDPLLDSELAGYRRVLTGYEDEILYRVAGSDQPGAGRDSR